MLSSEMQVADMERLKGADVCDSSGEKIGTVDDIYLDDDSHLRYIAVATGWFGRDRHVVPLENARIEDDRLTIPYDRNQLEKAPRYGGDQQNLTGQDETQIYNHYGLEGYWETVRARQTVPSPTPEIAQADVAASMATGGDGLRNGAPGESDGVHASHSGAHGVRRHDW